jgi:glycosyltransferase involved in cell wall biosynthesis
MPPSASGSDGPTLGFVVPWFGGEARGGAEMQAWETAREMRRRGWRTEILTSCSRSFLHRWDENHHPPGETLRDGVPVRRFPVDRRDEGAFGAANAEILSGRRPSDRAADDFIRHNINSAALLDFIRERGDDYLFVFIPYLYGTTVRGALVRPDRSLLMPCFHDEAYAHLEPVTSLFGAVRGNLYLTPEEAAALESVVGRPVPGRVVGGGIDTGFRGDAERFRKTSGVTGPFILYVGRLDRGKNTHLLAAYHDHLVRRGGSGLSLVLIGGGDIPLPPGDDRIVRLSSITEEAKHDACAAALLLCQPSENESFSRVIMEAWLNETPVLVSGRCEVTRGHCRRSGGGLWFDDYREFAEAVSLIESDPGLRARLGEAGRRYVLAECSWDVVTARVAAAVEELTGVAPGRLDGEPS